MTDSLFGSRWRALLLVSLSVAGIVLTVRAERTSESRANRLHRDGRLELAADIYGARLQDDTTAERLRYNLGTTLLRLGESEALAQLTTASATGNQRLRVSAEYNAGLWSLIQALLVQVTTDSIRYYAQAAVDANKAALRLDRDHADAAWNLALARRVVANATPRIDMGNIDQPNDAPELGEVQIIEGPSPFGQREGYGDTPSEGEEEARAAQGLEPLSLDEASEILGTGHLDPSTMTEKLLLRESRARRRRPTFVEGPPW